MNRQEMIQALSRGEDPLEISIQKWRDITNGTGENNGPYNCALCYKYKTYDKECPGCPVQKDTGEPYCRSTPYRDYLEDETQENAQKMLNYLKTLRPKPQKEKTHIRATQTKIIQIDMHKNYIATSIWNNGTTIHINCPPNVKIDVGNRH